MKYRWLTIITAPFFIRVLNRPEIQEIWVMGYAGEELTSYMAGGGYDCRLTEGQINAVIVNM